MNSLSRLGEQLWAHPAHGRPTRFFRKPARHFQPAHAARHGRCVGSGNRI